MSIIGSGGMSCQGDVYKIKETGASGVIIGRALYTGDIELADSMRV